MTTFSTLLKTEIKLSLRGMDMLIFALCMPIIVLIVLGMIYGSVEQSFGAIASIAISAGGLMGLPLVISDYRGKQILKRLQVTPTAPVMILLVQVTIYALYALVSLMSLLMIAGVFFQFRMQGSFLHFMLGWFFVMIVIFSIGMMVGGIAKDSKTAGIIASALYFPMLIFSGATLPYEVMPEAMQRVVSILPLTQGIKILKNATLGLPTEPIVLPILLLALLAIACTGVAIKFFKWE